ncbi:ribosome biogenesis protein BRX1 [Pelomyxa schiedti]|nr:ribosome biogenesis protein BRX1 [Pelomyxa schiedti]
MIKRSKEMRHKLGFSGKARDDADVDPAEESDDVEYEGYSDSEEEGEIPMYDGENYDDYEESDPDDDDDDEEDASDESDSDEDDEDEEGESEGGTTTTTTTTRSASGAEAVEADPTAGTFVRIPQLRNRKVLILSTRGIDQRHRHLMMDLMKLLPHTKKEAKLDTKKQLKEITEICRYNSCTSCLFFEFRRSELFLWVTKALEGPSIKFHVQNMHTMEETKLVGNCLKGSRPILSFDASFDLRPETQVMKELLIQVFAAPRGHNKTKPFIDHVFMFSIQDGRVWFRNYQIIEQAGPIKKEQALMEIGPRFCLLPVVILKECFYGEALWRNPSFVSPARMRKIEKWELGAKKARQSLESLRSKKRRAAVKLPTSEIDRTFHVPTSDT